jgi:hypothetical protein
VLSKQREDVRTTDMCVAALRPNDTQLLLHGVTHVVRAPGKQLGERLGHDTGDDEAAHLGVELAPVIGGRWPVNAGRCRAWAVSPRE